MKTRLLGALVGLAISFALPTFAQQKEPTLSEQEQAEKTAVDLHLDRNNLRVASRAPDAN